ncbi:hypothetical protein OG453_06005 [Streptomyces sp. NBC_01381]|uniref:hypothetical protein n=1 Tax=Streptomyces sp. NBC_01381 TaxID=2903845 RepID=UPI00225458D3|nr:hypothetical protein [Streptomyces sp. NBC_01381]MCX4666221.1 hypothetical protein [Streptomyces sp. NBC_01381]
MNETAYLRGKAEGRAEGRAEARAKEHASLILRVLEKRGVRVPEDIQERITSCSDLVTLDLWFDRSLSATAAEDLFAELEEGVMGLAQVCALSIALGLPLDQATAELRRNLEELSQCRSLSPAEVAYVRDRTPRWPAEST